VLTAAAESKSLDGIFKDAGRFMASMWAMYLHFSGGLTLPRLKEICAESGWLSAGRARAVLLLLRYLRLIEPQSTRARGEAVRYVPTAAFLDGWKRCLGSSLEAACVVEPAARLVFERLDEPAVFETFARIIGEGYLASSRVIDRKRFAFGDVFLHKHAGIQIVHSLLLTAADGEPFPPRNATIPAIAEFARNLRVSRAHVVRVLDAAERKGLLRRGPGNAIVFEERARAAVEVFVFSQLVALLVCAAKTAQERPEAILGLRPQVTRPVAQGLAARPATNAAEQPQA
jgi:hypothetical protein